MVKVLQTDSIANELKQGSAFFRKQATPKLKPAAESKVTENAKQVPEQAIEEGKRIKVRHTFDIFQDQLLKLHQIQFTAMQQGRKKPGIGSMVQEALDLYFNNRMS